MHIAVNMTPSMQPRLKVQGLQVQVREFQKKVQSLGLEFRVPGFQSLQGLRS